MEGRGERVTPLPFEPRAFVLLLPPFSMSTAAVYATWDRLSTRDAPSKSDDQSGSANDLMVAALATDERLARWRDALEDLTGRSAQLAGSGSTWFVEGDPVTLGLGEQRLLQLDSSVGRLVSTHTVPSGWAGEPNLKA